MLVDIIYIIWYGGHVFIIFLNRKIHQILTIFSGLKHCSDILQRSEYQYVIDNNFA